MNTFEIIMVIIACLYLITFAGIFSFFIVKAKAENKKSAMLSHRELWLYYINDPDFKGLLANNNGKGEEDTISPDKMTEKQYRFLVMFLNHMEYMTVLARSDLLPSKISFKEDWIKLFKNKCLQKVYENTKSYREKSFCRLVDKIIAGYEQD